MKTVMICRRWNNPEIEIRIDHLEVEIGMSMNDFITALADEAAEPLAASIAGNAGNPFLLLTSAQLVDRIVAAVESGPARDIFAAAAERVFSGMKAETAKVM